LHTALQNFLCVISFKSEAVYFQNAGYTLVR